MKRYISDGNDRYKLLDAYAEASQNGSGGLVITPENIDDESILTYPKENIAYAILEMPIRLLREKMDVFLKRGVKFDRLNMAGGPTNSTIWVKITEKIIGFPVEVTNAEYSGAVGAAMIAGKDI